MFSFVKEGISNFLGHYGYEVKKKHCGFSLNNNVEWIKKLNIKTVFDIGANDGGFALFINSVLPGARIYSFEPIKACYEKLVEKKKEIPSLVPFNYALGDINGELDFYVNDFSYSSSFLKISDTSLVNFPFTDKQSLKKAKVKRVDDMIDDMEIGSNVLAKIDVQGYEKNVLYGGENFFRGIPKIVIVETSIESMYEGEHLFSDILVRMTSFGYTYKRNMEQIYSPLDGSILQSDTIFIRE